MWLLYKIAYELLMMGAQSAIFDPVKYNIFPQHLHNDELVGAAPLPVETGLIDRKAVDDKMKRMN